VFKFQLVENLSHERGCKFEKSRGPEKVGGGSQKVWGGVLKKLGGGPKKFGGGVEKMTCPGPCFLRNPGGSKKVKKCRNFMKKEGVKF